METTQPSGILAPALTAFNKQLEIDGERTVAHFQWLLKQGCDALVIFGTTSEANSLSVTERTCFLEYAIANGIDPRKLLPGTGCCSLPDSVVLSKHAIGLGCPGVLMLPPFYYKAVSDEGLFRYFAALIDRFAPAGFRVFPGNELHLLPALQAGGKGCISAFANVNPALLQKVFQNWQGSEADSLQQEVERQGRALRKYPVIPGLKAILAESRKDPGWENIRPPLVELPAAQREALFGELGAAPQQ